MIKSFSLEKNSKKIRGGKLKGNEEEKQRGEI